MKTILDLAPEIRDRKLARMGMTIEQYQEYLKGVEASSDTDNDGWSDKAEGAGWSDEDASNMGAVVPAEEL